MCLRHKISWQKEAFASQVHTAYLEGALHFWRMSVRWYSWTTTTNTPGNSDRVLFGFWDVYITSTPFKGCWSPPTIRNQPKFKQTNEPLNLDNTCLFDKFIDIVTLFKLTSLSLSATANSPPQFLLANWHRWLFSWGLAGPRNRHMNVVWCRQRILVAKVWRKKNVAGGRMKILGAEQKQEVVSDQRWNTGRSI